MATECGPSNSPGNVLPLTVDKAEMSIRQQSLIEIKRWIVTEAGLYGRSDEEFLLLFLRSCEFDMKMTKKTLIHYYKSKRDVPQWWDNRNVKDGITQSILKLKSTIALMDRETNQPSVIITAYSRYSEELNNMDDYVKLGIMIIEKVSRRRSCQRNGVVWILDFKDYKRWIMWYYLNPVFAKNFIDCFINGMPVRMKAIIAINAPFLCKAAVIKLINPFLPHHAKGRIHAYGSDWSSKISEQLPLEVLPEEYGGQAGPMKSHEDAFLEELMAFNDYLVDDNQYGFQ